MSRFNRLETLLKMKEIGLVPVFYNKDIETAKSIVSACSDAGAYVIEFTNRGDFADEVFAELIKYAAKNCPKVILGVGSIVEAYTAGIYISKGTNFIVGPMLNSEVAKVCNSRKVPYSPGCGSATEVQKAHELGCEIVKVFPGSCVGGSDFIKSVKGPMPWTSMMPTGGVDPTESSLKEWFAAGIDCAGIGSKLITNSLIEKKDFTTMSKNIKSTLDTIKQIKSSI